MTSEESVLQDAFGFPAAAVATIWATEVAVGVELASMPSLPQVLLRILALSEDDSAGLGELAELIRNDPAICARLLTVANSPALRRGRELLRIEDCVNVLGTRFVRTLAACLAVQAAFDDIARDLTCDLAGFWRHSLEVAELARSIALATRLASADEAYLAGLLHDCGQLLLLTGVPDYAGVLHAASDEAMLCDLELRALGCRHAAVGAELVEEWQLDSFIADAILFHHEPAARIADADPLTRVLWAAHATTSAGEVFRAASDATDTTAAAAAAADAAANFTAALVALDADSLASLRSESRQRIAGIATALGIDSTALTGSLPRSSARAAVPAATPLAEAAQAMAFVQPLQESLFAVSSEDELLLTVRESVRILFGLGRMGMLLADPERKLLSGARIGGQPTLLRRIEIVLASSPSLTARAANEGRTWCSLDADAAELALSDIQILRALGGDALLCVPLSVRRQCSGMLVFGITSAHWPRLARRLNWLGNYARIVAASIEASREARLRELASEESLTRRYRLRARQAAHEAGNPLAIIRNYLKLLERRLADEGVAARELAFLGEEISRVAVILQQISDPAFAAVDPPRCDLGGLIGELLAGYREPLFEVRGIRVELDLPAGAAPVAARREALIQILLNLWKNAAEAMAAGGTYRIEVVAGLREGDRRLVEIRLKDSGPGLPAETWARLVAGEVPEVGARGLGLSIVSELVAALNGRIVCASQPGSGTLFCLHLPAFEA